jgi:diguanylate cyclase (GGDEF)-like protein/PAS domain S-box-containing protein
MPFSTPLLPSPWVLRLGVLVLGYFLAGRLGLQWAGQDAHITLLWMPAGIAVAAIYAWGWRYAVGVLAGVLALSTSQGNGLGLTLVLCVGNTLAPVAVVALLRAWQFNPAIGDWRDVVYLVSSTLLGMAVSATVGVIALFATHVLPPIALANAWLTWWLGDVVGVLLCGMALITYSTGEFKRLQTPELRNDALATLALVLLIGIGWMLLRVDPWTQVLMWTLPVVWLVLVAFRLGPWAAATSVFLLSVIGAWSLALGRGPFVDATLYLSVIKFWGYMASAGIIAMLVSALAAERSRIYNEIAESEARFRSLIELSSDWYWEQDENFRFTEMTGMKRAGIRHQPDARIGKQRWELAYANMDESVWDAHRAQLERHEPFRNFEVSYLESDGSLAYFLTSGIPKFDSQGRFTGYRGIGTDITARRQAEEAVKELAQFDTLTHLSNRAVFLDRLTLEIQRAERSGRKVAVLLLDLDNFKEVNDTMGHDQGDSLLVEAALRLRACMRQVDLVARLGGDEFVVIVSELEELLPVDTIAQNIIATLCRPFELEAGRAHVSASIGISVYPNDATQTDSLLKAADQAMYAAKSQGRNRFSYFTPHLEEVTQSRMWLTNAIRSALSSNQFWVAYQPIVDLQSGVIRKAEALLRWQHPERGLISPAVFIPVAESSGLVVDLGQWVFRQAAEQVRHWREVLHPEFQISVNLSPVQFQTSESEQAPWNLQLAAMGLAGSSIVAEITEGLLLDGGPSVSEKLLAFRDAGIQVALDDFGTGYSSLSYLQQFDIDYLKIDQSFVRNLTPHSKELALCEAMIVMAHKLGILVVAEGVETAEQRDLLRDAGCDLGQGYLFARPMPAADLELLLAKAVAAT